eukprot:TRINITY_DN9283_c0_g1_i2.p1 TRINITY_DN9283_c0_g1~~TRINITY_DN9283_c0_g1_i2.p1  ORF type:complete len:238 (-),score=19.22 TRINITY_DN9283_c0_g1_i2:99-812(-)
MYNPSPEYGAYDPNYAYPPPYGSPPQSFEVQGGYGYPAMTVPGQLPPDMQTQAHYPGATPSGYDSLMMAATLIKRATIVLLILIFVVVVNAAWYLITPWDVLARQSFIYAGSQAFAYLLMLYDVQTAKNGLGCSILHYISMGLSLMVNAIVLILLFIIFLFVGSCRTNSEGVLISCGNSTRNEAYYFLINIGLFVLKFALEIYYMVLICQLKDEVVRLQIMGVLRYQSLRQPPQLQP